MGTVTFTARWKQVNKHHEMFLALKGIYDSIHLIAGKYKAKIGKQQLLNPEDISGLSHSLKLTLITKKALTWGETGDCSVHCSADDVVHCKHPVGPN